MTTRYAVCLLSGDMRRPATQRATVIAISRTGSARRVRHEMDVNQARRIVHALNALEKVRAAIVDFMARYQ